MTTLGNGETVVMEGATGAALTVRLICLELFPAAFVAINVNVKRPVEEGVPLSVPVEEPKIRPAGNFPLVTVHLIGVVPEANIVFE